MKLTAAQSNKKPTLAFEDEISFDSLFDTPKFKAHKQRVEDVIRKSKTELTIRQIRERLGRHLIDGWLADALELLERETITAREKTANITVYRYFVVEPKEVKTLTFNHGIAPRKCLPYMEL